MAPSRGRRRGSGGAWRLLLALSSLWGTAGAGRTVARTPEAAGGREPLLGLEVFEDADCVEDPKAEILLELFSELCDILEYVLQSPSSKKAWDSFRTWKAERGTLVWQLSHVVFSRPYCEPGKIAGAAASCLLLLEEGQGDEMSMQMVACAQDIEKMLEETAPVVQNLFETRLHLFLRSPWPTFRLLDLMARLFPDDEEVAGLDLGRCRAHEDWEGKEIEFDWEWFQRTLTGALTKVTSEPEAFALRTEDGPLSEQYRARWSRVYRTLGFREAAAFGSSVFYRYRNQQWTAGCNPGVVVSYMMQVITFCIRDTEAWLQRYVGAGWRLMLLITPLTGLLRVNWPVFRALHVGSLLRRHPAPWAPGSLGDHENAVASGERGGRFPALALQERVSEALGDLEPEVVYITAVWGALAKFVGDYLERWDALALPPLLLLALDQDAAAACGRSGAGAVRCVNSPQRFGVEAFVAKYLALSAAAQRSGTAVWLDFDVYLPADPTPHVMLAFSGDDPPPLALSGFLTSRTLSPSVVAARGQEAAELLLQYASWLYEHPFLQDHQGWDGFMRNRDGDFSGSWDYKGRNHSISPEDGLHLSFSPPPSGLPPARDGLRRCARLGSAQGFGSGDGFRGAPEGLAAFHFWGAAETQEELFGRFYPFSGHGYCPEARAVVARYRRDLVSEDAASVAARADGAVHITAITYAHGCCAQSKERNRESALQHGADVARAYDLSDLDDAWAKRNAEVLSQRKGAGYWLWKPYVVHKTLRDPAVPWHTGVVLWLDAGNFWVGDPHPLVAEALRDSDVAAIRLKCCVENDWTSVEALRRLGCDGDYKISDSPQIGAYFLAFRKTTLALAFVEDWLRYSEDPQILMDASSPEENMRNAPGYQRHMADQSVFSVLFKQRGFRAVTLEEAHTVVQLDRWRE